MSYADDARAFWATIGEYERWAIPLRAELIEQGQDADAAKTLIDARCMKEKPVLWAQILETRTQHEANHAQAEDDATYWRRFDREKEAS